MYFSCLGGFTEQGRFSYVGAWLSEGVAKPTASCVQNLYSPLFTLSQRSWFLSLINNIVGMLLGILLTLTGSGFLAMFLLHISTSRVHMKL